MMDLEEQRRKELAEAVKPQEADKKRRRGSQCDISALEESNEKLKKAIQDKLDAEMESLQLKQEIRKLTLATQEVSEARQNELLGEIEV